MSDSKTNPPPKRMSLLDKMKMQTAGLRSVADVSDNEVQRPEKPKTGPGAIAALAAAKLRIAELEQAGQSGGVRVLALNIIERNPWQPRRVFDRERLQELAENIRRNLLLQPIIVRENPKRPGFFQIVAGERRYRAHELLEWTEINVIVVEMTDEQMALLALSENIQREDLTDYEIGMSISSIESHFPTLKEVGETVGVSRTQLYRLRSFGRLPEFIQGQLSDTPNLLGAAAASDIVKALSNNGPAQVEPILEQLWPLLKAGDLDQVRFIETLGKRLAKKDAPVVVREAPKPLFVNGKKAGNFGRRGGKLVIQLNSEMLTEDKQQALEAFLQANFSATED